MEFNDQEIEEFRSEAFDLLDAAEKSLLAIDSGAEFRTAFDCAFRGFHNLKGASGMMDLTDLQAHTHELENLLMQFKSADSIPKNYLTLFLKGIDAARSILNGNRVKFDFSINETNQAEVAEENHGEAIAETSGISQSALNEFLAECEEIVERVSKLLTLIEAGTYDQETLDSLFREMHSLKGGAYLFSYNLLGDVAHTMESGLEFLRKGTHLPNSRLIDAIYKGIKIIELEMDCIRRKEGSEKLSPLSQALAKSFSVIVKGLPLRQQSTEQEQNPNPVSLPNSNLPSDSDPSSSSASNSLKESESNGSIRVPVSLLDNLMNLMGEMVLVRNQVLQFSNHSEDLEFLNLSQRLNVVTSEIQGELMKTRMQPIGSVLTKFVRVVRDLSNELKKKINLNLSGTETELDKSILEAIKDPLTHIVRNSCDHGIETPEARRSLGKSDIGTIFINAYHEGGQVVIEVKDDGKGLNPEALIKKAIEKSLITESQASRMSEKEIFNLIFAPGFSTADQITNVSGRGVGMDVVKTNIEKIGGTVDLSSVRSSGTTIRIKIPLTLAIIPALTVRTGGSLFAIPQVKLVELVRVDQSSSENKIEYLQGAPVYRLRGQILSLVDLNQVLKLSNPKNDEKSSHLNIVVVNTEHYYFGLIVDDVQDTADIVVKPISRLLKSLQVYSGATILGDGSVALILDVAGISKVAHIGTEDHKSATKLKDLEVRDQEKNTENQDFLLLRLNSPTKHGIVLGYVHRLEEFKASQIEYSGNRRVVRYRKTILPIISASTLLGYGEPSQKKDVISVVVVERSGQNFGIEVEEIIDTLSTQVELDTSLLKQSSILGNLNTESELIVVIDPFELISLAFPEFKSAASEKELITAIDVPDGIHGVEKTPEITSLTESSSLQILFVEDTVFFRKHVKNVLESAGHNVTLANDGIHALEILKQNPNVFNLIISDIEMPRMNGFKLAASVRANPRLKDIPLLALSTRSDRSHVQEGLKCGFNGYLEKMKPEDLLKAIRAVVFSERAAS